jgi:ATP-dependent RNA helicase RhlE
MPPKIRELAASMLVEPVNVSVTPEVAAAPLIHQTLYHVPGEHKPALLTHLLQDIDVIRTVVFTRTKYGADRLVRKLTRGGVTAGAIHGNKSQNQRQRALDAFRAGRSRVLVATDVAARGLDVDGITHVFNFDLPNEPESYVHRIGRTGRAGATGKAISLCSKGERDYLHAIERFTGRPIEIMQLPEDLDLRAAMAEETSRRAEQQDARVRPMPNRKAKSQPARSGERANRKRGERLKAKQAGGPKTKPGEWSKAKRGEQSKARAGEQTKAKRGEQTKANQGEQTKTQSGDGSRTGQGGGSNSNQGARSQARPGTPSKARHGAASKPKRARRRGANVNKATAPAGTRPGNRRRGKPGVRAAARA